MTQKWVFSLIPTDTMSSVGRAEAARERKPLALNDLQPTDDIVSVSQIIMLIFY